MAEPRRVPSVTSVVVTLEGLPKRKVELTIDNGAAVRKAEIIIIAVKEGTPNRSSARCRTTPPGR